MKTFYGPRPPYRWQRGLLLRCLPRRFIPALPGGLVLPLGIPELVPCGFVEPVPDPVGQCPAIGVCCLLVEIPLFFSQAQVKA